MTPAEITPLSVLFEIMKRYGALSNKEVAGILLSGRPLSDGRSPLSRLNDRTWISRTIVHAPAGMLSEQYFCDFPVAALRLASRMKSRKKQMLSGEQILDVVCGEPGRQMDHALEAHGQDPTLYRNMLDRIQVDVSLSTDERAEVALVLMVTAACIGNVRRAVEEAQGFTAKMHGAPMATPVPKLVVRDDEPSVAEQRQPWLGLVRVIDGLVAGAPQWVEPTVEGTVVGTLALEERSVNQVEPDVSGRHARIWCDGEGQWLVDGLGSKGGTTLVSGLSGEAVVVEPPKAERGEFVSAPVPLCPGDSITFGASSTFVVIEGFPA